MDFENIRVSYQVACGIISTEKFVQIRDDKLPSLSLVRIYNHDRKQGMLIDVIRHEELPCLSWEHVIIMIGKQV